MNNTSVLDLYFETIFPNLLISPYGYIGLLFQDFPLLLHVLGLLLSGFLLFVFLLLFSGILGKGGGGVGTIIALIIGFILVKVNMFIVLAAEEKKYNIAIKHPYFVSEQVIENIKHCDINSENPSSHIITGGKERLDLLNQNLKKCDDEFFEKFLIAKGKILRKKETDAEDEESNQEYNAIMNTH